MLLATRKAATHDYLLSTIYYLLTTNKAYPGNPAAASVSGPAE